MDRFTSYQRALLVQPPRFRPRRMFDDCEWYLIGAVEGIHGPLHSFPKGLFITILLKIMKKLLAGVSGKFLNLPFIANVQK